MAPCLCKVRIGVEGSHSFGFPRMVRTQNMTKVASWGNIHEVTNVRSRVCMKFRIHLT